MPTLLTLIDREPESRTPMALLEQLADLTLGCTIPGSCCDTWLTAEMIEGIDSSLRRRFLKMAACCLLLGSLFGGALTFWFTVSRPQRAAYDNGYRAGTQATSSIRYKIPNP